MVKRQTAPKMALPPTAGQMLPWLHVLGLPSRPHCLIGIVLKEATKVERGHGGGGALG